MVENRVQDETVGKRAKGLLRRIYFKETASQRWETVQFHLEPLLLDH